MNTERLPPHNREAERNLLGTMLRNNSVIADVVTMLRPEHLYVFGHQLIFGAIIALTDQGKVADPYAVGERLTATNRMEDIGGAPYLGGLWADAPSAAQYRMYAETIREHADRRQLLHTSTTIHELAFDLGIGSHEMLGKAEQLIGEIGAKKRANDTVHVAESVRETYAALDERRSGSGSRNAAISTGFASLDEFAYGFKPGELTVIAARPSAGKTAIACGIVRHVAVDQRTPVLFFSIEQSRIELTERLLTIQGEVDGRRLQAGQLRDDEQNRLFRAGESLSQSPLYIDDTTPQNLMHIIAIARRARRTHGVRLVVIDYLQLIDPEGRRATRQEEVASQSRRLKLLARELQIPVIVLAQLNRESEKRDSGRPKMSDLRESGAIEQDADKVILLHRYADERGFSEGLIDVIVAKHRNGPIGTASLIFVKSQTRFEAMT